jgi:hypothetical protein
MQLEIVLPFQLLFVSWRFDVLRIETSQAQEVITSARPSAVIYA